MTPPRRSPWFYIGIIAGSLAAVFLLVSLMVWVTIRSTGNADSTGFGLNPSSIAVIDVSGVILSADTVDTQLRKFGDDSSVKAIILHINSPGGGAAASQEIYHEVLRVRQETHKKVIASIESVGASGAYYIASACDKIYANDASVVGSIGVIMEWTNYGDLLRWAKLKNVVIHAGELKDAGDPSRALRRRKRRIFSRWWTTCTRSSCTTSPRGVTARTKRSNPWPRVRFRTGQQSLPLGLIDRLGGFRVALMETAKDAGISGEPRVVRPPRLKRGLFSILSDDSEDLFPNPSQLLNHAPGFYFMWK